MGDLMSGYEAATMLEPETLVDLYLEGTLVEGRVLNCFAPDGYLTDENFCEEVEYSFPVEIVDIMEVS